MAVISHDDYYSQFYRPEEKDIHFKFKFRMWLRTGLDQLYT
jgi:hypothetical protein